VKLLSVVGARPNFMKIAPFVVAVAEHNRRVPGSTVRHVLVHSGQHYDPSLSAQFFQELGIPEPDHHLGVGSGSHAYQVGTTMIEFERVLLEERPDWVIVAGDVNATCACALTAKKHEFRVAHIEAGLRSNDWAMPEEINRVVTDRLSDLLFTTCRFANENLEREGVPGERVAFVGNIMIDTLEAQRVRAASRDPRDVVRASRDAADLPPVPSLSMGEGEFGVLTLHRPSNVDDAPRLRGMLERMAALAERLPIVFPVHPRTVGRLKEFGLWEGLAANPRLVAVRPLGYLDFLSLTMSARLVMTDSGGIQEECCVLGTPCLTLRENTERPATLAENGGTNRLVGSDPGKVAEAFNAVWALKRRPSRPPLWDGHAAERIVARLVS
jgi:UDP-N-acetylglucosamine 2-epimerase (non-hydrolysing)